MFVIVTYDVGIKRNARVLKECRRYLRHVQKSVFEGDLTEKQLAQLKNKIATLINVEQDQVAIYKFIRSGLVEKDTIGYHIVNENVI